MKVSAIRRFSTITKEGCVTDTEKEVIKQLRDRNFKFAVNKPGLWERIHKKWNIYVPQKFQSIFGCALTVLLEDPEYENFTGVVSILKGTYFGNVDFTNTFLMDFCFLLHISEYSGKTMEVYNVMVIEMGKNSDAVSDNDHSSDSKPQLHLNFQKKISVKENYSTVVVHTWARLPLLAFGTCLSKIYKILALFVSFREYLDLRLDLIYITCDRLTLGRFISRT